MTSKKDRDEEQATGVVREHIDPITQNIESVAALHLRTEQQVSQHQRAVEEVTAWLGRPQFLYGILVGVSFWMLVNGLAPHVGLTRFDDPPFYWLQGLLGLMGLLMTTVVLITQNRQAKLMQRNAQLDLQVSLLVDQKAAKIIELLEEMRRDSPSLSNRVDLEAEVLQEAVDPHVVLTALEFKLEQVMDSAMEMEHVAVKTENVVEQALNEVTAIREENAAIANAP